MEKKFNLTSTGIFSYNSTHENKLSGDILFLSVTNNNLDSFDIEYNNNTPQIARIISFGGFPYTLLDKNNVKSDGKLLNVYSLEKLNTED